MQNARVTIALGIQFLTEPLECDANSVARRLVAAAVGASDTPTALLLRRAWRMCCDSRIRPAIPLIAALLVSFLLISTMHNTLVKLLRWYAAARGSAFVAVATAALRELHAKSSGGSSTTTTGTAATGPDSATAVQPRPPSLHRWYTPQAVTTPVVCCACFQPVVVAAGAEGHAQCCELCGVAAHGSCTKAVPHNCRLLVLPPPPPPAEADAETGTGGGSAASGPSPPLPPAPLAHDWRPAGTTLDLILPPADSEMLLLGGSEGPGGAPGPGPGAAGAGAGPAASSRGPPSLCLYCGEPCEVGLLAVEPVWRCGACRRFTHVQCWSLVHPGVLSAATRAALEGQALEADEILPGTPGGASPRWPPAHCTAPTAATGPGGSGDTEAAAAATTGMAAAAVARGSRSGGSTLAGRPARGTAGDSGAGARCRQQNPCHPAAALSGGSGGGGGAGTAAAMDTGTSAAATAATAATTAGGWDSQRRCSSLPNIAGAGSSRASGGGQHPNHDAGSHSHSQPQPGGQRGVHLSSSLALQRPAGSGEAAGPGGDGGRYGSGNCNGGVGGDGGGGGHAAAGAVVEGRSAALDRLARLDACNPQESLGPLGALVLPPTAVRPAAPASSLAAALAAGWAATAWSGAVHPHPHPHPHQPPETPPHGSAGAGSAVTTTAGPGAAPGTGKAPAAAAGPGGGGPGGRGRKKQQQRLGRSLREKAQRWYHSHAVAWGGALGGPAAADAAGVDRWRHFRVAAGALPPGCRPLVVFINPRSGPQVGELLRRQLLQLLHPLQVVDLARESPSAALRCWWGVPGLRVLVVGGDGTVGWILGEMDIRTAEAEAAEQQLLQQQQRHVVQGGTAGGTANSGEEARAEVVQEADSKSREEETAPPPPQPPVAVLPLGTGNDLARVLGWGGGLAALDARGGVAAVLAEVAAAAPTPLDRWAAAITPTPPEPTKRGRTFLPRRRQQAGAAAAAAKPGPPAPSQIKVFNNYLGVGIDSWCALEFHRMRERYPGWFRSQLGNKMWYTGVGARDLLARSCVDLPSRLQLVCDGMVVELPPAAQGILLLNIPSYMGGVDLWGNGVTHQQQQQMLLPNPPRLQRSLLPQLEPAPQGAAAPGCSGGAKGQDASPEQAVTTASGANNGLGAPGIQASGGGGGGSGAPAGSATVRRGGGASTAGAGVSTGTSAPSPAAATATAGPCRASGDAVQMSTPPQAPSHPPHSSLPLCTASIASGAPATAQPSHPCVPQSMSDGVLEVVAVYGAVHLGQLQVGLARATRLCQCRTAIITTYQALPMQMDGEPWMQPAAQLSITLKGSTPMLRRLDLSSAASRLTAAVGEVLDGAVARGTITPAQRRALGADLARRLGAPHGV